MGAFLLQGSVKAVGWNSIKHQLHYEDVFPAPVKHLQELNAPENKELSETQPTT